MPALPGLNLSVAAQNHRAEVFLPTCHRLARTSGHSPSLAKRSAFVQNQRSESLASRQEPAKADVSPRFGQHREAEFE